MSLRGAVQVVVLILMIAAYVLVFSHGTLAFQNL
jgi:hypothetical protein